MCVTIRDTLWKLGHVGLVPQYRHHHLLHQGAEVLQGVGMDVPAGEESEKVGLGQRLPLPLDKVDPLVLQRGRPVRVGHQMPREILTDDQFLQKQRQTDERVF